MSLWGCIRSTVEGVCARMSVVTTVDLSSLVHTSHSPRWVGGGGDPLGALTLGALGGGNCRAQHRGPLRG